MAGREEQPPIRFTLKAVRRHIDRHLPNCPKDTKQELINRVCTRAWEKASIGTAVGIVATTYVRHAMTDYDRLLKLKSKLLREEARLIVRREVTDIVRAWGPRPVAEESGDLESSGQSQ